MKDGSNYDRGPVSVLHECQLQVASIAVHRSVFGARRKENTEYETWTVRRRPMFGESTNNDFGTKHCPLATQSSSTDSGDIDG
jgi:hypothetical protein